jgi:hypothetical protein
MATLLADIMFKECNSSFLRQPTGNKSFFLINVYRTVALGRYVALLWDEDGKSWCRHLPINDSVNFPWSFMFSCTEEMEEIMFPCLRAGKIRDRNGKKFHETGNCS